MGADQKIFSQLSRLVGSILLIAGTAVGAGMIGLPVRTALAGFGYSTLLFLLVWLIMTITAFATAEVAFLKPQATNLISMAYDTLGSWGKNIMWIVYLLFLYSVMAAYTAGGASIFEELLQINNSSKLDYIKHMLLFAAPFILSVYFGAKYVDYLNRVLIIGLVTSFCLLCAFLLKLKVPVQSIFEGEISAGFFISALPIAVTSFGYHGIIPSLKAYLREDTKLLPYAIFIGGMIPLLIYLVWEYIVFSVVPREGVNGLLQMLNANANPGELLVRSFAHKNKYISLIVGWFSFFALTSSFVGVALGIVDFFADGLKVKRTVLGNIMLISLAFLPPMLYSTIYPQGFLLALEFAGAFAAILLIIYPAVMAYSARYCKKIIGPYQAPVGKFGLIISMLFGLSVILMVLLSKI